MSGRPGDSRYLVCDARDARDASLAVTPSREVPIKCLRAAVRQGSLRRKNGSHTHTRRS
jgi:hypothetical protein